MQLWPCASFICPHATVAQSQPLACATLAPAAAPYPLPWTQVAGARRTEPARPNVAARSSKLEGVEQAPPDPILGVTDAFKKCTADGKLNLGVGAYRTEELQPYVLDVVRKAEQRLLDKAENKEYLPIDGLPEFKTATMRLLLGEGNPAIQEGRAVAIQSLSGTGSLRVGAAFIERFMSGRTAYISNPTWGNHRNIFADAGVEWKYYRRVMLGCRDGVWSAAVARAGAGPGGTALRYWLVLWCAVSVGRGLRGGDFANRYDGLTAGTSTRRRSGSTLRG